LHPSLRILLYLVSALALPGLNFFVLALVGLLLALIFARRLSSMLALCGRARWLFLLLAVGYAYSLPGVAVWPALGDWSPSQAGMAAAGLQMWRLLLLLWLLDGLVLAMGTARMMSGLHGLFSGLAALGFPSERTTVRLALTLQAMEGQNRRFRDFSKVLQANADTSGSATLVLVHEPWRTHDSLLLTLALLLLVGSWLA
jgi:hypothetical protein